jgi:thiamine pyrophosphokinase
VNIYHDFGLIEAVFITLMPLCDIQDKQTMAKKRNNCVTLLGGAGVDDDVLARAMRLAPDLYCADGGANAALARGLKPTAVFGDLDSILPETEQMLSCPIHLVDDQNSTDFEKCLGNISAKVMLCMGFVGGRLDHSLAAVNALAKFPDTRAILVGDRDISFLAPPDFEFDANIGDRVSLFPLAASRAKSHGLLWPLDALTFGPTTQIGTSNQASHQTVQLYDVTGSLLVILPLRFLEPVSERLINTPED